MFRSLKKRLKNASSHGGNSQRRESLGVGSSPSPSQQSQPPPRSPRRMSTGATELPPLKTNAVAAAKKTKKKKGSKMKPLKQTNKAAFTKIPTTKIAHLSAFDACVEAADALATTAPDGGGGGGTILGTRRDAATGLLDGSVLVSPEGDLLLIPEGQLDYLVQHQKNHTPVKKQPLKQALVSDGSATTVSSTATEDTAPVAATTDTTTATTTPPRRKSRAGGAALSKSALFSELMLHGQDDYPSAIFLGHDLDPAGAHALNGFDATGWSIPASVQALEQTQQSMTQLSTFCEALVLCKKQAAAQTSLACDNHLTSMASANSSVDLQSDWQWVDPATANYSVTAARAMGPLWHKGSSMQEAMQGLEDYHNACSEHEAARWRKESSKKGFLPALYVAAESLQTRAAKRQAALQEMGQRVRLAELKVEAWKEHARESWELVYQAEAEVTKRMQEVLRERNRQRELARLEHMQSSSTVGSAKDGSAATTPKKNAQEIWNLVNAVADDGSFEPMDLPQVPSFESTSQQSEDGDILNQMSSTTLDSRDSASGAQEIGANRDDMEVEVGLPELRAAAFQAEEEIRTAANALLEALAMMDTIRRSARVAAETALVSAGNAQANCLRSLVQLERETLQERLDQLQDLETKIDAMNIRADLDAYITSDKQEPGGSSQLGETDDGGVAAALAVLTTHIEEQDRDRPSTLFVEQNGDDDEEAEASKDWSDQNIHKALSDFFDYQDPAMDPKDARAEVEASADLLCRAVQGTSPAAKSRLSKICYSLNTKRSSNTKIQTKMQFDGLCCVFSAILTACDPTLESGVALAKMCMMLAQSFYWIDETGEAMESDGGTTTDHSDRSNRIYVKSHLAENPLWSKDEFWDEALRQQIYEALSQSRVMSEFERKQSAFGATQQRSEWTRIRKTQWYDLPHSERLEAAKQVQQVIFSQLGALAHSMMEFGCGLERSCAFVRRMSVRNQLPSAQRVMLLQHLLERRDATAKDTTSLHDNS